VGVSWECRVLLVLKIVLERATPDSAKQEELGMLTSLHMLQSAYFNQNKSWFLMIRHV
jgi:hypothetical protein